MKPARKLELEDSLTTPAPQPPAGLLARLHQDIPRELPIAAVNAGPIRRDWWRSRLAASLFVAVVGGMVAYRVARVTPVTAPPAGSATAPAPYAPAAPAVVPAPTNESANGAGGSRVPARIDTAAAGDALASGGPGGPGGPGGQTSSPAGAVPAAAAPSQFDIRAQDDSGNALPGVSVSVRTTGGEQRAITDAGGLASLRIATGGKDRYFLKADLEGFQSVEVESVTAVPGRRTTFDLTMSAAVTEVITVIAPAPLMDSRITAGSTLGESVGNATGTQVAHVDRLNVGGNETGRQSRYVGAGEKDKEAKLRALGYLGDGSHANGSAATSTSSGLAPSTGGTAEPNEQPYGDMFFRSAGTNPFVDTDDDALSTFGLDVDTGAYAVARRYLRDGQLPPREAIRVEEFVNAFHYGDEARWGDDFTLHAEGARSPYAAGEQLRLVRFSVASRPMQPAERKPAALTFVVDVSGSMAAENRLELVKRALGLLLGQLRADDRVGLVVYGSQGRIVLEPSGDHQAIAAAIAALQPEGATNAEEGIRLGYEVAQRAFRPGAINRILLCSDGVANVGATGPETILASISAAAARGIQLSTIGFGMGNYNDALMEQLADQGDGAYAYVDDLDEARRVFVENLTGTLQTIAEEAKAQVEWNPDAVARYRLLGYENRDIADERFRDDTVDAGEIGAGHTVTALYEIKLQPGVGRRERLATLRVRYRRPDQGDVLEIARELHADEVGDRFERASPALRLAASVAQFAELLGGSYWARGETLEQLARETTRLAPLRGHEQELDELRELIARAAAAEAAKAAAERRPGGEAE